VLAREQRRVIYAPWGVRWGRDLPNVEDEGRVLGVEEIGVETSTVPCSKGRTGRRVRLARLLLVQICVLAVGAAVSSPPTEATTGHAPAAVRAAARAPVVTIAGDIAGSLRGDLETGPLVQRINPTYALVAGDEAYEDGTAADYAQYDQSWARFKAKTRPTPGNHDYHAAAGSPPYYYTYFAAQLPGANGGQYYAFDVGRWRLYSLNCEIDCSATSAQAAWLRNDLATAGAGKHKMAYLHRPRFSCGHHGSSTRPSALWDLLLTARADVIVAAHDHLYERYPRMSSAGTPSATGMVSFVVGTGGASHDAIGTGSDPGCALAGFRQNTRFGVLKLTLATNAFSWAFIATDNGVLDSGTPRTLDQFAAPTPSRTATRLTATATGHRISGMLTSVRP
jgi:hypothetical protein